MAIIVASISNVLQQVASLANASTWFSFSATVTASTALVALYGDQPFSSTALDAGKILIARGAGAAGTDYVGNIATVTNATTAVVGPAFATAVSNTPIAMGGNFSDDRHSYNEIIESIFEADEQVCTAIAETAGHYARPDLLTLSGSITSGNPTASRTSTIGDVLIKNSSADSYLPGTKADLKAIQRYNANSGTGSATVYGLTAPTAAGSPLAGYYAFDDDGALWYTGTDAKVRLFQYSRTAALQSPNVYGSYLVYTALKVLTGKDGDSSDSNAVWAKFSQDGMAAIRLGAMNAVGA